MWGRREAGLDVEEDEEDYGDGEEREEVGPQGRLLGWGR